MSDSDPIFEPLSRADDPWRATSVRPLAKLLAFPVPVWVIAEDETLAFLSAACGQWLGVAPHDLLGRSVTQPSTDPLDAVARALAPPARGRNSIQTAQAHPPAVDSEPSNPTPQRKPIPKPLHVTFIPLTSDSDTAPGVTPLPRPVLAIGRKLTSSELPNDTRSGLLIDLMRRQLASDSRRSEAPIVLGGSIWAQRLRRQVDLAAASREHVILIGGAASAAASVARLIESKGRNDKPSTNHSATELLKVDAALMDA
ncbi:MAG: hypothetical protein KDA61_07765, partial [Planctomycetales bacterium]|nr:hypothetical protein [Planctomycetales bacterium]